MEANRLYQLCLMGPTTVVFRIQGQMPQFSSEDCFALLRVVETGVELFRYNATFGSNPALPMVAIDQTISVFFPEVERTIEYAVLIPPGASSNAANLSFRILSPDFELSPVIDGVDTRCLETVEPPVLSVTGINLLSRIDQTILARLIFTLYTDLGAVERFFQAFRPPIDSFVGIARDQTTIGGIAVVKQGDTILALKIGTTADFQLVIQGGQFLLGPVNWAGIGTINLYAEAGIAVLNQINVIGLTGIRRIIFAGHSLGGAAVSVAGAWLSQRFPEIAIEVLTFGCPRPGDATLATVLEKCLTVRIENVEDPVPYLPPARNDLVKSLQDFIGPLFSANLFRFRSPRGRRVMWADGTIQEGEAVQADTDVIGLAVAAWFTGAPGPDFQAHDMSEYVRRLEK